MLDIYDEPFIDHGGSGYAALPNQCRAAIQFRFVQLHSGELYLHAKGRDEDGCVPIESILPNSEVSEISGTLADARMFRTLTDPMLKSSCISIPAKGSDGFLFQLTDAEISAGSDGSHARFYLTNLCFMGTAQFRNSVGGYQLSLPIMIAGLDLRICPVVNYSEQERLLGALKKPRVSAYVEVPLAGKKLSDIKATVDNLCWLLSFARGTKINWLCAEVRNASGDVVCAEFRNAITWEHAGLPPIPAQPLESPNGDRRSLANFIEASYENFVIKKQETLIQWTIDAIVKAKAGGAYLEMRGMLIASSFDALLKRWAKHSGCTEKHFADKLRSFNQSCESPLTEEQIVEFKDHRNALTHETSFERKCGREYTDNFWVFLSMADHLVAGALGWHDYRNAWVSGINRTTQVYGE